MPRAGFTEVVLVTGYPSFGAKQLVAEILENEPETLVYAVVKSKLLGLASTHLAALPDEHRARLQILDGDAAHMDLGLSGAEFRTLCNEVDRIHHCAQVTYQGVDKEAARHLNVVGTIEALELAKACHSLRSFVHHSTAFVSGDRTGLVREDELDDGQRFRNAVEETKAHAERLVKRASDRVPTIVLRPAMVVGDSKSGEVERLDGPYLVVLLILSSPAEIAIPLPGRGDAPLHLVPIDYVTRAARQIGRDSRAIGKTFHLVDPQPLTARRVFELVARAGGKRSPRGFIPVNLTKALLKTPGLERFAKSPRAFVDQLVTPVRYDARNTESMLAGTGTSCPPFESYVDSMVGFVRSRVEERRAEKRVEEAEAEDSLSLAPGVSYRDIISRLPHRDLTALLCNLKEGFMTTHSKHPAHAHAHQTAVAAATIDLHEDPHASDEAPTEYALSPDEIALIKSVTFLTGYQIVHTSKAPPDVIDAFDAAALSTVGGSPALGGAERVKQIEDLKARHAQLLVIAAKLGPLLRLVGQNLLATDALLAAQVGETLKIATGLKGSSPHLLEGLSHTRTWSKEHHPGRGPAKPPAGDPTKS